jgi:predicted GNAT family acetyltransferase
MKNQAGRVEFYKQKNQLVLKSGLTKVGSSQKFLLLFDVHWDNPHCDRQLLKKHLDQAREFGAPILFGGDLFCLMQGRYDPRRSRAGIRPEHDVPNYLDAIVDDAAEFFAPYADLIVFLGKGNHELMNEKNCETSVLERFAERLRIAGGKPVVGGIGGWWTFKAVCSASCRTTIPTFWHHGHGGGGPVTKGVIQTNRRAVYLPDARFVFSGHIHEEWQITLMRDRINTNTGTQRLDEQIHVTCPTYKQEYDTREGGFHTLNGRPPKPLGGVWFTLAFDGYQNNQPNVIAEATRAK